MPNMNRIAMRETVFQASAVNEVKKLHQVTMMARARRGPIRSPSQPPGIWKSE